jgi:glycosyltransferase involved in cell wall biosynthesis
MRVIHLVPSIGPAAGGLGTAALETARAQCAAGIDAVLWCTDAPDAARAAAGGCELITFPLLGPARFAFSRAAEQRALTAAADIVHQHGLWTAQGRLTHVFRRRGIPTVVAPHGSLAPYALRRSPLKKRAALAWFEAANLRQASCLHATSAQEVKDMRAYGLRSPAAVVPNAVGHDWLDSTGDGAAFRARHRLAAAARVMLYLSRIHPIKGLPMLLDALAHHRDRLRDWMVVIAGPDEIAHRAEIERRTRDLGLSAMVMFPGSLYGADKRDAFAAADLFVLPTHTENFGIVVAEALACAVPVLTTKGAPWPELETERCGWWVRPDAESIGAAIVDAASRPVDELRAMGGRGKALVAARFVWPLVAARTAALYAWLTGRDERPDFVMVN